MLITLELQDILIKLCIPMYDNIRLTTGMHNSIFWSGGIAEHQSTACAHLVKMLTWYIWIKLHTCLFQHCPAIGMQNRDEAAGRI